LYINSKAVGQVDISVNPMVVREGGYINKSNGCLEEDAAINPTWNLDVEFGGRYINKFK